MAHSALKFDTIHPNTCPPDTTELDEAWSDEPAPRDSYVALKTAHRALPALPPPPRPSAAPIGLPELAPPAAPQGDLSYDVWDSPRGMLLLFDVPGIAPEHISASLGSHALHVAVQVPQGLENLGIPSGHYEVCVELPGGVPPDTLDASLSNGVLRIRVPKSAAGPRRLIPISSDSEAND